MPLREVSDINARYDHLCTKIPMCLKKNLYRLDAVQALLDHPAFEDEFTQVAKGLPDLERIVSRIHAKNCKVKDFLKVLGVSNPTFPDLSSTHKLISPSQVFQEIKQGTWESG